jgi:hypothetical protein
MLSSSQARELSPEDRLDVLGRSLFAATDSPGVHGRTAVFETVIDGLSALITRCILIDNHWPRSLYVASCLANKHIC